MVLAGAGARCPGLEARDGHVDFILNGCRGVESGEQLGQDYTADLSSCHVGRLCRRPG